jgi:hypothetical protein
MFKPHCHYRFFPTLDIQPDLEHDPELNAARQPVKVPGKAITPSGALTGFRTQG